MNKYEWTDSGRELLLVFQVLIQSYGGVEKLARDIENEVTLQVDNVRRFWSRDATLFLLKNHNKMTNKRMGELLGKSKTAVENKLNRMRSKGLFTESYGFKSQDLI